MFASKILQKSFVTHDVTRYVLEKPEGFSFVPGQAADVSIKKPGWENEKRPFTFTCLQNDRILEFTIKSYPERNGVTKELPMLAAGDELLIGDIFGTINYKGPGIFIAAGAGITPFISILRSLYSEKKINGNILLFSNKTRDDVILENEFRHMLGNNAIFTLTREKAEGYENGRIDISFLKKHVPDFSKKFYICGPPAFVDSIKAILAELGAKPDAIVFEE